jgi:hypothetical protein
MIEIDYFETGHLPAVARIWQISSRIEIAELFEIIAGESALPFARGVLDSRSWKLCQFELFRLSGVGFCIALQF